MYRSEPASGGGGQCRGSNGWGRGVGAERADRAENKQGQSQRSTGMQMSFNMFTPLNNVTNVPARGPLASSLTRSTTGLGHEPSRDVSPPAPGPGRPKRPARSSGGSKVRVVRSRPTRPGTAAGAGREPRDSRLDSNGLATRDSRLGLATRTRDSDSRLGLAARTRDSRLGFGHDTRTRDSDSDSRLATRTRGSDLQIG